MGVAAAVDFWRWQPHPEVWVLIASVVGLSLYAVRVVGPKVVSPGQPVMLRSQRAWLVVGVALLWLTSDWPLHDLGEKYLYSLHMVQHLLLTFVVPPVLLMATPEWLARLVLGTGSVKKVFDLLSRPVVAGALFSGLQLLSHWYVIVNTSSENGLFHYGMHAAFFTTALLFWMPVCGPLPELRLSYFGQMLYLFVASIVPTVPAGWLVFADGAVYSVYDIPDRLFGVSVVSDQQAAGVVMKLMGGFFLWMIITVLFFRWASRFQDRDRASEQVRPSLELTFDDVAAEFERSPAPAEPSAGGPAPR